MIKIAFQMNNIHKININSDTTFSLVAESFKRGFEVYYYNPEDISLENFKVLARVQKVKNANYSKDFIELEEKKLIDLEKMDIIWLRQDPPFNMAYITSTYFLELIMNKTLVLNNPVIVRNNPEKLIVSHFKEFTPKTLISRDISLINSFIEEHETCVIKPLYEAKGDSVFLVKKGDVNTKSIISLFLESSLEPFIIQKFIPNVVKGDKRIILLDGEFIGLINRVPAKNDIKSNLAAGGTAVKGELTEKEKVICNTLKPFLKENNLFLVGIDVIDEYLTEVNVTSPTGVMSVKNLYNTDLAPTIIDKMVEKYNLFKKYLN